MWYGDNYPSSSQEVKVRLRSIPPPKALEKALAARFIKTMASSSQDQPDLQFFFFAKHVRKNGNNYADIVIVNPFYCHS